MRPQLSVFFFFFNDTATTEIYTLSLHDALPICPGRKGAAVYRPAPGRPARRRSRGRRSEEHTSELQSQSNLVCRLLLEKKKKAQRDRCDARDRPQPARADDRLPSARRAVLRRVH